MPPGQILIVSADERWRRVLEVTIRLGGGETLARASVGEALRMASVEGQEPSAIVVDLGAQTSTEELDGVRGLVQDRPIPAVVILPERLSAERERFSAVGAAVLVRPYRPSELYAALWPDGAPVSAAVNGDDSPLGLVEPPDEPADVPSVAPTSPARPRKVKTPRSTD